MRALGFIVAWTAMLAFLWGCVFLFVTGAVSLVRALGGWVCS